MFSFQEIIERANKVHDCLYDYSLIPPNVKYTKDKVDIICKEHGVFNQSLKNHILHKTKCPMCSKKARSMERHPKQQQWNNNTIELLSTPEWLHDQNHNYNLTLTEIAHNLDVSVSTVWNRFQRYNIPTKHFKTSLQEEEVFNFVKQLDITTTKNDRLLIYPYEIDIISHAHKICIEYDGIVWHSEYFGNKDRTYHKIKSELCKVQGYQLIHIFENEWINSREIVKSRLQMLFGMNTSSIYARNLMVRKIKPSQQQIFFNETHLQGSVNASICYGLFTFDDKLVAAMSFGKSRFGNDAEYELLRFSTILNVRIVGGASKLFKSFVKEYAPTSIKTFADIRWSNGNLYHQLGFVHSHNSLPNFYYFRYGDALNLLSRQRFQKHKLKNLFQYYKNL